MPSMSAQVLAVTPMSAVSSSPMEPMEPMDAFRSSLAGVLAMRNEGRYDAQQMNRYTDALVALPDADLARVYHQFSKVYMHQIDADALRFMQLSASS